MSEIVNPGNSARAASQQHGGGYLQGHCYARLAGLWQKTWPATGSYYCLHSEDHL